MALSFKPTLNPSADAETKGTRSTYRPSLAVLDILRGGAASYVLCNHARGALFVGGQQVMEKGASLWDMAALALLQLTTLGAEAVILFFVVSGYAMAHSLASSTRPADFYLRRIIRIWPPYLIAVLLAYLAGLSADGAFHLVFYLGTDTPYTPQFWSLVYEVIFYAMCPLLLRRGWLLPALTVAVALTVGGALLFDDFYTPTPYIGANFFFNGLFFFLFGAALSRRLDLVPVVAPRPLLALFVLGVVSCFSVKFLLGFSLLGCLIIASLAALLLRNLQSFPGDQILKRLGVFAYSIYLYHYVLLTVVVDALGGPSYSYSLWLAAIPPVIFGCWLLYWLAEYPTVRLLARMRGAKGPADQRYTEAGVTTNQAPIGKL